MYNRFAEGYYNIMKDTIQKDYCDYLLKLFEKYNISPEIILDLGCGTGDITYLLAEKGYDMIGVDISEDMLNIAREKNSHKKILYLNQDMREFELYGTVDVIYSSLDCFNYITNKNDLKKVVKLCKNYLNPNGLLIFDINTLYKYENILNGNTFTYDTGNEYLVWQNEYDKKSKLCYFFLDMFYKKDDLYERFYEEQVQRAYSLTELKDILTSGGFKVLDILDGFKMKKAKENSEKVFFVCKG